MKNSQLNMPIIVAHYIYRFLTFSDHNLEFKTSSSFNPEIDSEINLLKGCAKTFKNLTETVNKKFNTSFQEDQIKYRVNKLIELTYGQADKDAYEFVRLAEEDRKNGSIFHYQVDENNKFMRSIYLSKTMLNYSKYFLDVVLVDSTYKRNRFNLILVNVIGISNCGKNIMLAFGLLSDEKIDSYTWFFGKLKEAWNMRSPLNFVSDEAESILRGVRNNFSSRQIICGWHVQKNIMAKLSGFKKKDEGLYKKALSLPFIANADKFEETLKEIYKSKHLSKDQIDYIKKKVLKKNLWAKCCLKTSFAGGVSTTSRIEGLHAIQKKYLIANSSLQKVFKSFRFIENSQELKFYDEFSRHQICNMTENINALEELKKTFLSTFTRKLPPNISKELTIIKN